MQECPLLRGLLTTACSALAITYGIGRECYRERLYNLTLCRRSLMLLLLQQAIFLPALYFNFRKAVIRSFFHAAT